MVSEAFPKEGSGAKMLVSVETWLRRRQRQLRQVVMDPRVRAGGRNAAWLGSGFFLSAASILGYPQPLVMGLISALSGRAAVLTCLGAVVGFPFFWGAAGNQGIVWAAAAGLLGFLLGRRQEPRDAPLMIPFITGLLAAVSGLVFQLLLADKAPPGIHLLRTVLALASSILFTQTVYCRDAVTDWLVGGVAVLALAQVFPLPYLGLGYVAAGAMMVSGAFPEAALAGAALDLSRVAPVPMTAVTCLGYFLGMIPYPKKWQRYALPAACCLGMLLIWGSRDITPLPGLLLGGSLGALAPPRELPKRRSGGTGRAQVRLELSAQTLMTTRQILAELEVPPVDQDALLDKVKRRACGSCSARRSCCLRLDPELLADPLSANCRKPGRLVPELRRAQEQLRELTALRRQQREYRQVLMDQYAFLGNYLQSLADSLPRSGRCGASQFRIEVSARSRGKERANGDLCMAFPGTGQSYYVLLCDGMGTGLGAAQEGAAAAAILRKLLAADFPAAHALRWLNSLLVLRGAAGAVTVDLAQIQLDTGIATVYKWGAAPSWLVTRGGAQKIGTATPPPGISVGETREAVVKLSLRRGEVLILLSDGVDGEEVQRLSDLAPDAPPGELAAKILERGGEHREDDATAAVLRLRPIRLTTA